jgi:NADH ubiquinone oxidoreductase, 20 Kd subunit
VILNGQTIHELMASGACAADGGVFAGRYAVAGGVSSVVPVDLVIPGCPPSHVPGSPSSALHTTKRSAPGALRQVSHLTDVGKPAAASPAQIGNLHLVEHALPRIFINQCARLQERTGFRLERERVCRRPQALRRRG